MSSNLIKSLSTWLHLNPRVRVSTWLHLNPRVRVSTWLHLNHRVRVSTWLHLNHRVMNCLIGWLVAVVGECNGVNVAQLTCCMRSWCSTYICNMSRPVLHDLLTFFANTGTRQKRTEYINRNLYACPLVYIFVNTNYCYLVYTSFVLRFQQGHDKSMYRDSYVSWMDITWSHMHIRWFA